MNGREVSELGRPAQEMVMDGGLITRRVLLERCLAKTMAPQVLTMILQKNVRQD